MDVYDGGAVPARIYDVQCVGNEDQLVDCSFGLLNGYSSCNASMALGPAGVVCQGTKMKQLYLPRAHVQGVAKVIEFVHSEHKNCQILRCRHLSEWPVVSRCHKWRKSNESLLLRTSHGLLSKKIGL